MLLPERGQMDNSTNQTAKEATRWVLALTDAPSLETIQSFEAWIRTSPEHARQFSLCATNFAARSRLRPIQEDAVAFWARRVERILMEMAERAPLIASVWRPVASSPVGEGPIRKVVSGVRRYAMAPLAAAFIGALLVSSHESKPEQAWTAYKSLHDTSAKVLLADGTLLTLNPASVVRTRISDQARVVQVMEGAATFSIAPDIGRPFSVRVNGGSIETYGTRLTVAVTDAFSAIHVNEGTARLSAHGRTALLYGAEAARISRDGVIERVARGEQAVYRIRDETLAQVAAAFNRDNALQVFVEGSARDVRFTGRVRIDSMEWLAALEHHGFWVQIHDTWALVRMLDDSAPPPRCPASPLADAVERKRFSWAQSRAFGTGTESRRRAGSPPMVVS